MPTRGLEPPHLAAIDPKSIATASSATSACQGFAIIAELGGLRKLSGPIQLVGEPTPQYPTDRSGLHTPDSVYDKLPCHSTVICLKPPVEAGGSWLAGCDPTSPVPLRRDLIPRRVQDPLALLSVARSPSRHHC